MSKRKTFRELFEEVTEPWGKLAIENMEMQRPELLDEPARYLKETKALAAAFRWSKTPQGHVFWAGISIYGQYDETLRQDLDNKTEQSDT